MTFVRKRSELIKGRRDGQCSWLGQISEDSLLGESNLLSRRGRHKLVSPYVQTHATIPYQQTTILSLFTLVFMMFSPSFFLAV
jgi:hypothetical protein